MKGMFGIVGFLALAGCDSGSATSGPCTANAGCEPGEVCVNGDCVTLCVTDAECDAGEICDGTTCAEGQRTDGPAILEIDGEGNAEDGTTDSRGVRTGHHLRNSVVIRGVNLQGVSIQLVAATATTDLTPTSSSATEVVALLPNTVEEGSYALRVVNGAGEDQTEVWLLRGEQGEPGDPKTAAEVLTLLQSLGDPVPGLHATTAAEAATLTDAGGTPHTYEELAGADDGVPAGAVMYFAMNTCPAGWIPADGQIASRDSFPDLYAAIGDTYGAGDGSTTFGKPDLRGEFLRGWDNSRGADAGRAFGSSQGSATRLLANVYFSSGGPGAGDSSHGLIGHDPGVQWVGMDFVTAGASTFTTRRSMAPIMDSNYGNAAETRPRNVAMLACIKH